jgi:hypothetical protein
MAHYIARLPFPNQGSSARRRKMRILSATLPGRLSASALIAALFVWAHSSGRF